MGSRWHTIVIDAADPARLARWWGAVLGYEVAFENEEESVLADTKGSYPRLVFVPVEDAKVAKNRLHIDLNPDDLDAEVERLVDMGARHVDVGQKDVPWTVLADPEGNEFCVLTARE